MIETKVVISVSGRAVTSVFTNNPEIKVYLVDYDNLRVDPNGNCSEIFPTNRISEFHAGAVEKAKSSLGIAKLIARINA